MYGTNCPLRDELQFYQTKKLAFGPKRINQDCRQIVTRKSAKACLRYKKKTPRATSNTVVSNNG